MHCTEGRGKSGGRGVGHSILPVFCVGLAAEQSVGLLQLHIYAFNIQPASLVPTKAMFEQQSMRLSQAWS